MAVTEQSTIYVIYYNIQHEETDVSDNTMKERNQLRISYLSDNFIISPCVVNRIYYPLQ